MPRDPACPADHVLWLQLLAILVTLSAAHQSPKTTHCSYLTTAFADHRLS